MAGYKIKAFLIAQSLNQIEKAYGQNNAILDNCHVRVAFATNDERTAKRVSDALGTATEMRAMKNYAGHRLSPWLGHLMVSRQESARALLTPGEVMQLPPSEEIVLVSGVAPIRAQKARYYRDRGAPSARVLEPPTPKATPSSPVDGAWTSASPAVSKNAGQVEAPPTTSDDEEDDSAAAAAARKRLNDQNSGVRREPDLPEHENVAPERRAPDQEFSFPEDEAHEADDERTSQARAIKDQMRRVGRQAGMDPADGLGL